MRDIEEIKKYIIAWSKQTFSEGVEDCAKMTTDKKLRSQTMDVINRLGLTDRKMNGDSVTHLPHINEHEGLDISFIEIFNECNDFISPVYYLAKTTEVVYNKNCKDVVGIVARSLRAFPAFLREMDLADKIERSEFGRVHKLKCICNAEQDMVEHTDLKVDYDQKTYRICSYQISSWALEKARMKIRGEKNHNGENAGKLPPGFHVLFPLNTSNKNAREDYYRWFFYLQSHVDETMKDILGCGAPYDEYDFVKSMDDVKLNKYLEQVRVFRVM